MILRILFAYLFVLCANYVRVRARSFPPVIQPDKVAEATFNRLKAYVSKTYFSNEELDQFVVGMAGACSDIMTAFEFGRSAKGTRMLAVDISSTAGSRCAPRKLPAMFVRS